MSEVRIGHVYEKISKDEIPVIKPEFKMAILETLENFATEIVKRKKLWVNKHPVEIVDEINQAILEAITSGKAFNGTPLSEKDLDHHRQLRIQFYRLRRAIRNLIQGEEAEEP